MNNCKLCLIALILLAANANAQPTISEKMDVYLMRLAGFGLNGSVLVAKDGQVILEKGYGWADRKRNLPFTKDTVVDIGSNTKDLTKTAILQLAQAGKLKLNDTLPKFFDHVPADKAIVTVEQLMEHTAGFGQYSGRDEELLTKEEFLKTIFAMPLIAEPGKEDNYSNPGYSLLAAIIEKVSGKSYERYVQERILAPAGMTTTGYSLPQWREGQLARNYADGEERPSTFDYPHLPDGPTWNLRGNGGTLSTVGEMYKFYRALSGDKLLAPAFKARLFDVNAPLSLVGGNGIHFFVYQSDPANRLVLLLATTDSRVRATELSGRLAAIASGRDVPLPPVVISPDPATLARWAGNYQLPNGAALQVAVKGETLFVSGTNEAGFQALQGNARGNPEQLARFSAQVKTLLEAAAKGDHAPTHKAFGAAMPYEQLKARQDALWQQRRERLGAFQAVKILNTTPGPGGFTTTARLDFERGADYAQFIWGPGGMLRAWRPAMAAPGASFYPHSANEFVSFNLATGESLTLRFQPQDNGFRVEIQASTPAAAPTAAAKLPDTPAGRVVAAYLNAYQTGSQQAMREFLVTHLSKNYLALRPLEERLKSYQRLREDLGDLRLSGITEPSGNALAATFATATGKTVEFLFELDGDEPQKLKGLRIELR